MIQHNFKSLYLVSTDMRGIAYCSSPHLKFFTQQSLFRTMILVQRHNRLDSCILDFSDCIPDSISWIQIQRLDSGFQSPGFRIPQAKIFRIPNPDYITWAENPFVLLWFVYDLKKKLFDSLNKCLTVIPPARMGYESIAHKAK